MPQSPQAMAIHVFGLTGGIATGKSTVAAHWRQRGLPVVDADELAREVVAPGTIGLEAVVKLFGPEVRSPDGSLDRSHVAKLVFADKISRAALESVLHPLVGQALSKRARDLEQYGEVLLCYEASLLIETGRADAFRPLVLVVANENVQIQRVMQRDGSRESEARARIAAQLAWSVKAAHADLVIPNDVSRERLLAQADSTLAEVCRRQNIDALRYGLS